MRADFKYQYNNTIVQCKEDKNIAIMTGGIDQRGGFLYLEYLIWSTGSASNVNEALQRGKIRPVL